MWFKCTNCLFLSGRKNEGKHLLLFPGFVPDNLRVKGDKGPPGLNGLPGRQGNAGESGTPGRQGKNLQSLFC